MKSPQVLPGVSMSERMNATHVITLHKILNTWSGRREG